MILLRLLILPVRLMLASARLSASAGYRVGRLVGYPRIGVFLVGLAVGLAVAPVPGRELRSALRRRLEARGLTDADLLERVRFELAHHPRTWHLPQPEVTVVDRRVTLRGELPDDMARHEIVRATTALAGVIGVDDRLRVGAARPSGQQGTPSTGNHGSLGPSGA